MKSIGIIVAMSLAAMSLAAGIYDPVMLCAKSDFSMCVNVTYPPTGCVNMDNVTLPVTSSNGTAVTAVRAIESVIVSDVDRDEYACGRCVVLFEAYNCQGQKLVLDDIVRPSAVLDRYGFANRAQSFRKCSHDLLEWLSYCY